MFRNTELTEATRKNLNWAEGISPIAPGGCQPRAWQCLEGWNHPDIPRNSQSDWSPRRKRTETTITGGRSARRPGWGAEARRCTAGIHSRLASLPPWRQFGSQGNEKAEEMWVIIGRSYLCSFQLLSHCVGSVSFPQWRMDVCYWAEVVSFTFVFDLIETAHDIWAVRNI